MNVFVYRDTFFELRQLAGAYALYMSNWGAEVEVARFPVTTRGYLHEIRKACDEAVLEFSLTASYASGDVECTICGKPLRNHKRWRGVLCMGEPFLNLTCDGKLVKL